jgi:hypothetical protein
MAMVLGEIFHTIRYPDASWQPWGNVSKAVGNNPGLFKSASCATVGYEPHIIALTTSGKMRHTIRFSNSWQPWGNVDTAAANNPGQFELAICAGVGDDLHVFGKSFGELYHTIRYTKLNSWQDWRSVTQVVANNPGQMNFIACADVANDLHLVGITPTTGNLYHTIRFADGHWQDWDNLSARVGGNPGQIGQVACSGIGHDLHIIVGTNSGIHHTIRDSNGAWQNWGKVSQIAGLTGAGYLSCARVGCGNCNDLHVLEETPNNLEHTIRFVNTWQAWDDVSSKIANFPSSGHLKPSCTGVGNNLHVIGIEEHGIE